MSYDLVELGWDSHFAQSLQAYEGNGLFPGRVAREDRERYTLLTEAGEVPARLPGSFLHRVDGWDEFPSVGDWVLLKPSPHEGEAMIHALLPRRTVFKRKAVLVGRTEVQVLAANIDTVFLVSGLDGDFNPRRIERYLSIAWDGGAVPVLLLNKADLCDDVDGAVAEVETSALGAAIHAVSALQGEGLEALRPYIEVGKTVAFLGSSGVGKSTIVNRLLGEERQ
jgi:ribosome biogenesis GTPase